jgi:Tfp pilus assembly protein PilF
MTMEGRWKRLLASVVLCGLIGCNSFRKSPNLTPEPPLARQEKPKDGPVGAEAHVVFGNVRLQASVAENRTPQERQELQDQARLAFQQALKRDPKNLNAMLGMARLYAVVKDKERCVEWYEKAGKAHPAKGDVPYEMGKALGSHFKDKDGAIQCFHAATKLDPENRKYRSELGFTLAWAGRYDEAYAWISRVMPEAKARYNLAGFMQHNGHADQAKQQLALAVQADPGFEAPKKALSWYSGAQDQGAHIDQVLPVSHEQVIPLMKASPQFPIMSPAPVSKLEPASMQIQPPAPAPTPVRKVEPVLIEPMPPAVIPVVEPTSPPARVNVPAQTQNPNDPPLNRGRPTPPPIETTSGWDR